MLRFVFHMFISVQHLNYAWVEKIYYYNKKKGENERDRQTDRWTDGQMRERILMNHYSYMVNK